MKTLVVGLLGGPGSGKSTMMAGVFADLKNLGVNCEMAPEWIKEACWEGRDAVQDCQPFIWAQQLWRIRRLCGKVDVVLTDSPPILSTHYGTTSPEFRTAVEAEHRDCDYAINCLAYVIRSKPYNPAGRWQTQDEAEALDGVLRAIPADVYVSGNEAGKAELVRWTLRRLGRTA